MCVNAKCFPMVPIRHWGRKQQRNGESPTAPDIQYLASEMLVEVVILVFIALSSNWLRHQILILGTWVQVLAGQQ